MAQRLNWMHQAADSSGDYVRLWDLYPLADDAWPNIQLSVDLWSDWLKAPGQTIALRRWVPGPNGPSFLTEYTPADDNITEGHRGSHNTFNGLYRDEDREFYIPRAEDLQTLERVFATNSPATPDWTRIRVALCARGYADAELVRTKAPVLVAFLAQMPDQGIASSQDQLSSEAQDAGSAQMPRPVPDDGPSPKNGGTAEHEERIAASPTDDVNEEQLGGPEEDPYDHRVVRWVGKRLYLGPKGAQVRELFMLLARKPGVPHALGEVQRAVDGMETYRDEHGEDAFRKSMNRIAKALSKLRSHLRENGLDDHVVILKEGPRDEPSYTLISRFGNS